MKTHQLLCAALIAGQAAQAQSLEQRMASAPSTVAFQFRTRAGVCGNGMNIMIGNDLTIGSSSTRSMIRVGRMVSTDATRCDTGPAHVIIEHSGASVRVVEVGVGGSVARAETDLGEIAPAEAARYLLAIAPGLTNRSADNAVMGAAIADAPSHWRRMLDIARSPDATEASRKSSLFWVSREVDDVATAGLRDLVLVNDDNTKVQSDALFYLAQRKDRDGIPALIRVVRESGSTKLRKDAIFYLAQSKDPRALDLFEKLLSGR